MSQNSEHTNFSHDKRVNEILEVIYSFARLDFEKKVSISDGDDVLDGIGTGVNMLGEELNHSSVSLREKEQLLKEIHHRVKNNMQIISSLLSLQSENISDPVFLSLVQESKNRIHSMALVHEMLYKSKDLNKIELKEYVDRLVKSIDQSFSRKSLKVDFNVRIPENQYMEIDKMIPIGLILNELLSNSFKYAFTNVNNGIINIEVINAGELYKLEVSDNGVGVTETILQNTNSNLGIQLVRMLSQQLDGSHKLSSEKGVKFELIFPK